MGLPEGSLRSCLRRAFGTILVHGKYSEGLATQEARWDAFYAHYTDRKTKEMSKAKDPPKWWKQDHKPIDHAAPRSCADGSGWSSLYPLQTRNREGRAGGSRRLGQGVPFASTSAGMDSGAWAAASQRGHCALMSGGTSQSPTTTELGPFFHPPNL